jgi:TonB-linked SusC/RagA family outer membrane protein
MNATHIMRSLALRKFMMFLLTSGMMLLSIISRGSDQGDIKITLAVKNVPLSKVLKSIEKQTGLTFIYNTTLVHDESVSLNVKSVLLNAVLKTLLQPKGLIWEYRAKTIVLKYGVDSYKASLIKEDSISEKSIRGQVTDVTGTPLPGASIIVNGTQKGTVSNERGEFSLKHIPSNAILSVSFTGYSSEKINLKGRSEVNVQLALSDNKLDETVIMAYGTTTRRFNTGSISSIKGEEIRQQPVTDPLMALEGRIPGLYISQSSGIPGSALTVRLRGQNSIANGNNPLYIIDGVPYTSESLTNSFIGGGAVGSPSNNALLGVNQGLSPFNNLNPNDIESIEVLKDADATAIYGSRGANGVILITTRKGKAGKTNFDLNVSTGAGGISNKLNLLNTSQYLGMRKEAFLNDNLLPIPRDNDVNGNWDTTRYTDWQKVLIGGTAKLTNAHASISGGNTNTQFLIGGGYTKQTTVFPGNYADQKASMNFNLSHLSTDQKFRANISANYLNDNSNLPLVDFTSKILLAPDAPSLYDSVGNLNWQNNTFSNPLGSVKQHANAVTNNLISNLILSYELAPGLIIKSNLGYTHVQMNQSILIPLSSYPPAYSAISRLRRNSFATNDIKTLIVEPQINYTRNIGIGKLELLVGSTFQKNTQSSIAQDATDFTSDELIKNITAATTIRVAGNTYSQYNYNGIFSRINYNLANKYIFNVTARRDGSSRFGPGKQFGNFGAIGAAWIFSQEGFIKNSLPFLSFGKLRASFGTTGNDQIPDYQYLSTYSSYYYPYLGVTGLYPTKIANPYFGWEVVKKAEIGLETSFFKDIITFNANFYRNKTGNQLVGYPLPSYAGFTTIQYNLPAVVQNTGFEFELGSVNVKRKYFTWSSSINISIPRNKLISYPNLEGSAYKNTYVIGRSIFTKKYLHYTGIDTKTGYYTVEDVNKDNQITDPDDYQTTKQICQNYYGGIQNSISYKGIQFDCYIQFVNQTGNNFLNLFGMPGTYNQNQPITVLNQWSQYNNHPTPVVQRYSTGGGNSNIYRGYYSQSDQSVVNASFIRLKNISVSYSLPEQIVKKISLKSARIYVQAQNLLTITEYKGLDPETQSLNLPSLRMINAGISLSL